MGEHEPTVDTGQNTAVDAMREVRPDDGGAMESAQAALLARMFGERTKTIGRYELRERLGSGGFGVVHVAWDPELQREVAIKLLRTDAEGSTGRADQLLTEARIAGGLSHPNIVAIHDVGHVDAEEAGSLAPEGGVFVVMELVSGQTLRQWLDPDHAVSQILDVFSQAGAGLAAAHAAGVVHRDFKPANVLIDGDGRVRVADFGLAGFVHEVCEAESDDLVHADQTLRTAADGTRLVGTVPYMAPEQLTGALASPASDQYAFCLAMREALEHRALFTGGVVAQREAKRQGPPRWREGAGVSRRLRAIIDRGLAVELDARWPDMAALLGAIEQARRPSWVRRRSALLLGGGALALGSWGFVSSAQSPCQGTARSMGEVWSPDARARVEASLLQTEAPHAAQTVQRVKGQLDALAERWVTEQRATCELARAEPAVAAAPLACLARLRGQVAQAVEVLSHADREVLDGAAMLVAGLPSPEHCELVAPQAPGTAAEQDVEERLARADVLVAAGHFEDATRIITAVQADAEQLGARPLIAAALSSSGSMLAKEGRYEEAAQRLRSAMELGLEVDARETAAQASATLSYVLGSELARSDEGLTVASVANALGRGLGPSHPGHANALYARGIVHRHAGRYEDAEADHRRALEIRRRIYAVDHPKVLDSMVVLSVVLGAQRRNEEAIELMREAIEIRRRMQGDEHPDVALSEVSLGAMLTNMDRFDPAHEVLSHAVESLRESLGGDHPSLAVALQNFAALEHLRGHSKAALPRLEDALRIHVATVGEDHPSVAMVRSNIGAILRDLGQLEEARHQLAVALTIDRAHMEPTDRRLVTRLRGLAAVEAQLGHHAEAEALWAEAIEVATAVFGADHERVEQLRRQRAEGYDPTAKGDVE